jgi:hypothetical protein
MRAKIPRAAERIDATLVGSNVILVWTDYTLVYSRFAADTLASQLRPIVP